MANQPQFSDPVWEHELLKHRASQAAFLAREKAELERVAKDREQEAKEYPQYADRFRELDGRIDDLTRQIKALPYPTPESAAKRAALLQQRSELQWARSELTRAAVKEVHPEYEVRFQELWAQAQARANEQRAKDPKKWDRLQREEEDSWLQDNAHLRREPDVFWQWVRLWILCFVCSLLIVHGPFRSIFIATVLCSFVASLRKR